MLRSALAYQVALPATDGQWPRARLLAELDAASAGRTLTWLTGLPGAGKTSLAAAWVRRLGDRLTLWYRLAEDDRDVANLFSVLRQHPSLLDRAPALAEQLPVWSPENQADLGSFARRFFGQIAAAAPLTLVLDDCHRVPDEAPLFDLLDALRDLGDAGLRVLAISRRPPPALLARGRMAGWLSVLDDVSLRPDEACDVAHHVSGRSWHAGELAAARGWMAHVLALARADGRTDSPDAGTTPAEVGDYLCEELLRSLPEASRRDFRLLAELPEVPEGLRDAGRVDSATARLLDTLAARRYFVDRTAAGAWRMHDLLRDGLRSRNRGAEPAAGLADARRERGDWVAPFAPDTALPLYVAAGDTARALALLAAHGRSWLAQGRHRQVLDWLLALPPVHAPQTPDALQLTLWEAEARLPLEPEAARPLFTRALAQARQLRLADAAYAAWCGAVASYVVQWGAVQGLAELVDELETLGQELGPPPPEWRFRTAADALTALMYGRAEDPRIRHYAAETAQAVEHAPDAGSRIAAAAQLLIYRMWWAGDFPGGRALYNAFDAEVDSGEHLAPLPRLLWWSIASIVDWQCGDPERCHDKVQRGLALAEASGIHVRDFFLLTQGIFCALSQEDWPRAEAYLERLGRTERSHRRLDTMVHHFFRSWHCLSRGDAATALAHAETAWPMAVAMGSLFHKIIVLSALAPARLHCGDAAGAQQAYREQLALAKGSNNPTFSYIAFCASAEIALLTGDTEGLAKQVERMLMVKQLGGFHSDCGWRTPVRAQLLAFALRQGLQADVARRWIAEKRIPPPDDALSLDWPMPVRIHTRQGLEVHVDGPSEPPGPKPPKRLLQLLSLLVEHRDGLPQTDLLDRVWPESEGDKAAASLKVSVHRLRAWLGHDAVLVRNSRVSLNPQRVRCDAWG